MPQSSPPKIQHTTEGDVNGVPDRARFLASHIGAETSALLARDAAAYLHQSLSTPCLNALASARGSTLTDLEGRVILDFHGNSVHQVGHAHPRVLQAVRRQLDTLPFCPRRFTNEPAVQLAERLAQLTHGALSKVLLTPSGSLSMGLALKLARIATGRHKTLSMWGAFHGAGLDTISIGGEAVFRENIGPLLPGCEHVMPCRHARQTSCDCASTLEAILAHEPDIAAVIAEPIRCTTVDIPHPDYWPRVRAACDKHGALLVFDEIPIALGRTGRMFAHEHFGVTPDILVLGKGLGGGLFPQAALLARPSLDVASHTALGHYTHEKSPLGAAAALATLDILREEHLVERSRDRGAAWTAQLHAALAPTGLLREIRSLGLLIGIELVAPSRRPADTAALTSRILYDCMARGLSFKVSGASVLTLTPPLNASDAELDAAASILTEAIAQAAR